MEVKYLLKGIKYSPMPWYKNKETLQILQIITNIVVIISFLLALAVSVLVLNQYSLLKQEYEWKFGTPEVIMYNNDLSPIYGAPVSTNPNISLPYYKSIKPKNDIFICNSRGRPILLVDVSPVLQGPTNHHPEIFNFSEKVLRQNDCEELRINFPLIYTLDSEKVDGTYELNVTVVYFDKEKRGEKTFLWDLFEIKNNSVIMSQK